MTVSETPQTLWQGAFSFALAVEKLTSGEEQPHVAATSMASMFLSGFALELVGKAYLLHVGSEARPKHDLIALYRTAAEHGLRLSAEIETDIRALAPAHIEHAFRYMPPGFTADLPDLAQFPERLLQFVRTMGEIMAGGNERVAGWLYE